jgi:hypothetical protein
MASLSSFTPSVAPPETVPAITPFSDPSTLQTSNTSPAPALMTTTVYTNSVLNSDLMPSGDSSLASGAASQVVSHMSTPSTNPTPWVGESGDNLTASPVYLFIFAIALGALIVLSLTIVIRSLVLRQRLIALHGPDWRRQYGANILDILGLSTRRVWDGPITQPIPQHGRRRRRDHGQKPVLVDVYVSEGKGGGCWKDVQVR